MSQINGHISQIIGPVIDVYFDTQGQDAEKVLPKIYEALKVKRPEGKDLLLEVEQHIGEDTVRCIAMDSTDGLQRGLEVIPTGISAVSNSSITYDIYTLSGVCLKHQANTLKGLRRGVYIINGKKVIIK